MLDRTKETSRVVLRDDIQFDLYCEDWTPDENRIYEPDVIRPIMAYLKPDDVCIDAGASLGYHSMLMAQLVGDGGEVLAFEPDPNYFVKLKNNIELNGLSNVCALPVALWECATVMPFHVIDMDQSEQKYAGLSSFIHYSNPPSFGINVLTQPLDAIVNPDAHVRLIKIDCEGSEEKILRGAEQLLKRGVDCVIVEFNYKIMPLVGSSDRAMRDYMANLGYDCFFLHKDNKPSTYIDPALDINIDGGGFHFNVMFARP